MTIVIKSNIALWKLIKTYDKPYSHYPLIIYIGWFDQLHVSIPFILSDTLCNLSSIIGYL